MAEDSSNIKLDKAKQFLAALLDDTLSWGSTDKQHALEREFKILLGDHCPAWLDPDRVVEE